MMVSGSQSVSVDNCVFFRYVQPWQYEWHQAVGGGEGGLGVWDMNKMLYFYLCAIVLVYVLRICMVGKDSWTQVGRQ